MRLFALIAALCAIALTTLAQNNPFAKTFIQIEESQKQNLPQTTITLADSIYTSAKLIGDRESMLKAALIKASALSAINENQSAQHLEYLQHLISEFDSVELAILNSHLASMLWQYYLENQWRLANSPDEDSLDVSKWQSQRFKTEIEALFLSSLDQEQLLQNTPITKYPELIDLGNCKTMTTPTLFDVLVKKAINYFSNIYEDDRLYPRPADSKSNLIYPVPKGPMAYDIEQNLSKKLNPEAVKLYGKWLEFRAAHPDNKTALYEATMDWYRYIRNNDNQKTADSTYLEALTRLEPIFESEKQLLGALYFEQAQTYQQLSQYETEHEVNRYACYTYRKNAYDLITKAEKLCQEAEILPNILALKLQIETPELEFAMQEAVLPNQPFLTRIKFQNTDAAYVKVFKISHKQYIEMRQSHWNQNQIFEFFAPNSELIDSFLVALPNSKNFFEYSTELWFKPLPKGIYLVSMADNKRFDSQNGIVTCQILQVSELMASWNNQGKNGLLYINHRQSGEPLSDIRAYFIELTYGKEPKPLTNYPYINSDKNGQIAVPKAPNQSLNVVLTSNTDTLYHTQPIYLWNHVKERKEPKIWLFTDRAIYRPGQTLYFKALVTQQNIDSLPNIEPDFDFGIILKDANGQNIQTKTLKTNASGTANGSFSIPLGLLAGNWQLFTQYGSIDFKVENYKRPTFKIEFEKPMASQAPDSGWTINGKATRYTGVPVSDAHFNYVITRQLWHWGYRINHAQGDVVYNGTGLTLNDGSFNIAFNPALYSDAELPYQFYLNVTVTNASGESQNQELLLPNSKSAANLVCQIEDVIDVDNPQKWDIKNEFYNGTSAKSTFTIKIDQLVQPEKPVMTKLWEEPDTTLVQSLKWLKKYPQLEWSHPNWKAKQKVAKPNFYVQSQTNCYTANLMPKNLKQWEPGLYRLEITATDSLGQKNRYEKVVEVFSSKQAKIPYPTIWWAKGGNKTLEPGSAAEVKIGTAVKLKVLMQVAYNKKIIHSEWISLNNQLKTISWPVTENLRGGFAIHFYTVYNGQAYQYTEAIQVPYTNKQIEIKYLTLRNELSPGSENQTTISVSGKGLDSKNLEMLAGMYDASLDQFAVHQWYFSPFTVYYYNRIWQPLLTNLDYSNRVNYRYKPLPYWQGCENADLKSFSFYNERQNYGRRVPTSAQARVGSHKGMMMEDKEEEEVFLIVESPAMKELDEVVTVANPIPTPSPKVRDNFAETVFFYPELRTDSAGNFNFTYTLPDNLTTYKLMTLVHSPQLEFGYNEKLFTVKKELMATLNLPRFVTQGDTLNLVATVENLTGKPLNGTAVIEFSNPFNGKIYQNLILGQALLPFVADSAQNATLNYTVIIPDTITALQYKLLATSGNFTDGEQKYLPVLSRKTLITETQPLWINGIGTKTFKIQNLMASDKKKNITHQSLTIEITPNPIWYAIWALPGVINTESTCNEQIFNTYFASVLSTHIAGRISGLENLIRNWQQTKKSDFASFLAQNSELKQLLLTQTPWVMEAQSETDRLNQLGELFNRNQQQAVQNAMLTKLKTNQNSNGSWGWYPAMTDSRQITQHIVGGFAKQNTLIEPTDNGINPMLTDAILYLDQELVKDFTELNGDKIVAINNQQAEYLYIRHQFKTIYLSDDAAKALAYFDQLARQQWAKLPRNLQATLAMYFMETNQKPFAEKIMKSIDEFALKSDEMGIYWKENTSGMGWYQSNIEFQCSMIEAYKAWRAPNETIDKLKVWLLKNKQTHLWQTPKATTNAVYALITSGTPQLADNKELEITVGKKHIGQPEIKAQGQTATGYFKTSYTGSEITPDMGNITLQSKTAGISWGGAYWQYFTNIDEAPKSQNGLSITKKLYLEPTQSVVEQSSVLKVGQKVKILLMVTADRNLEFVHISDKRPANFEPTEQTSGYRWNNGIGYYQSFDDATQHYFIDDLPKGHYVFEYSVYVTHSGTFGMGSATVQSFYAPAFMANSGGRRIKTE